MSGKALQKSLSVPRFIAFIRKEWRHVVDARDAVQLASLLPSFFSCDAAVGMLQSFESEQLAVGWLAAPAVARWVKGVVRDVSLSTAPPAAAAVPAASASSASLASSSPGLCEYACLLSRTGGYVADKNQKLDVVQLLNTLTLLHGEQLLVFSGRSASTATEWMRRPLLSLWLMELVAGDRPPAKARVPTDAAVVVINSDSETESVQVIAPAVEDRPDETIQVGATPEVQELAASLPPPTPPNHGIFSMQSIREGMALPVSVKFVPFEGRRASAAAALDAPAAASSTGHPPAFARTGARASKDTPAVSSTMSTTSAVGAVVGREGSLRSIALASRSPRRVPHAQSGAVLVQRGVGGAGALQRGVYAVSAPHAGGAKRQRDAGCQRVGGERPSKRQQSPTAVPYDMDKLSTRLLDLGKSVFVSGGGGVGKTRLLRLIKRRYKAAHRGSTAGLATVAPTGVSSAIAGGVTTHAFLRLSANCFDWGKSVRQDAERIFHAMNKQTRQRLATTNLLLLDEVSMVSRRMFAVLVYCLQQSRVVFRRARPWRIIAFGDFYQLPPVRDLEDEDVIFDNEAGYAFECNEWDETFGKEVLELKYVWRQEDVEFVDMLSKLRVGVVTEELSSFMEARLIKFQEAVKAAGFVGDVTHILPRTKDVAEHNEVCLSALEATTGVVRMVYTAVDKAVDVNLDDLVLQRMLDKSLMAPRSLPLCVGARVAMCDGSLHDQGVYNGTTGVVVRFVRWENPTMVHDGFDSVPVVRFHTVSAGTKDVVVIPSTMSLQSVVRDGPYAQREQLPLMLAWGVTVHRVQGLSLDRAVLDLGAAFCAGMVYVCLSRVRTMDGVFVKSFSSSKVTVDVTVSSFYDSRVSLSHSVEDCVERDSTRHIDVSLTISENEHVM